MNYIALHSFALLGALALVSGCAAEAGAPATSDSDLEAESLRFDSASLVPEKGLDLAASRSNALYASFVEDGARLTSSRRYRRNLDSLLKN